MLAPLLHRIASDPIAVKMSYPERMEAKLARLHHYFPDPSGLEHFFAAVLANPSLKVTQLDALLGFTQRLPARETARLFHRVWPCAEPWGLTEDKAARLGLLRELTDRLDLLRRFTKTVPVSAWDARPVARALGVTLLRAMELLALSPRLARGVRKPLRPVYALLLMLPWLAVLPPLLWGPLAVLATWWLSTRCALAPGVLWYPEVRRRLGGAPLEGCCPEFHRARRYEDGRVRVEVRDKRTLEGALQFLTSSEEIGNCIALRNFVAWTLPALLADPAVVLADVSYKGQNLWQQRAQIWMVAAQREGRRVLTVNSLEFNNEGVKHLEALMPAIVEALRDVAARAGFEEIYVGISDYGRAWLDARFPQGCGRISKVHGAGLGFRYHFDSFRRRGRGYEFVVRRSLLACAYALLVGGLHLAAGNRAKGLAFLDTARNRHNCWQVALRA